MDGTTTEENINVAGKRSAEVYHTEHIVDDDKKSETPALTAAQIRRFVAKMDLRVLPMLGIIYAVSIIDRINIGSALVLGMDEDLKLGTSNRYSTILLLFFPSYALTDVPSNWILTHVSPRWWLSFLMFCWGAILTGMAFLRFLLGAFEGGVLPGVTFTISCWYTRKELHNRIAFAYGVGLIASAFAGILSFGLGQMDGIRGMSGWRWVFSIEGAATMLIAAAATVLLPTFPDKAKWLKPDQKVYLFRKLEQDHGQSRTEKVSWRSLAPVAADWRLWLQGSVYGFNVGTANAVGFFAPSIIEGLGYSGLQASLRSGFPFFAALGLLMITSTLFDRFQRRVTISLLTTLLMMTGFILMRADSGYSNNVRYLGIFFGIMGVHCNVHAMLAFNQSNTLGTANRAVSSGLLIACGAIGGIIGSLIFRGQDAPEYGPGIYTVIGMCSYNLCALSALIFIYSRKNKRLEPGEVVDLAPEGFRYSL
ncbi:hypothetical protein LTR37_018146 [Vermiconidia calcicola]|uniref:Uncharacterized protein n=1 Tax=Vermiconidia calcicola TaxID=1690605 RepID=A0ACC3MJJ1_9PEZI|nr:hypothetical protein LTR37_018146 [Vermiconidia calcicola]